MVSGAGRIKWIGLLLRENGRRCCVVCAAVTAASFDFPLIFNQPTLTRILQLVFLFLPSALASSGRTERASEHIINLVGGRFCPCCCHRSSAFSVPSKMSLLTECQTTNLPSISPPIFSHIWPLLVDNDAVLLFRHIMSFGRPLLFQFIQQYSLVERRQANKKGGSTKPTTMPD